MSRPTFEQAKRLFPHRFTVEQVPSWAKRPDNGRWYAPQFATDREWYNNTLFNGESDLAGRHHCYTSNQSWPLGEWLDRRYCAA